MKLDRLDLNKLYTFFAVVEHDGISGAARSLSRTRSAVSQSLSSLEASLDRKLFDREGKKLVLRREGQILHSRFRLYQSMLQGTVDEIVNEEGAVRGPIWLGLYHGFPSSRLAEFIAHFLGSYPDTSIRLTHAPLSELTTRLLRGRLDFSLSFQPGSAENQRLYGTKLYDQELVLAAGRSFFRRGFDPDELRRVPVIDYYQSAPLISRWLEHHYGPGADGLQPKVWAATTDLALELVLKQVGAAVLPSYLVAPLARRHRLKVVETGHPQLSDSVWLNERRDGYKSPALTAFRAAVLEEFSQPPAEPTPRRKKRARDVLQGSAS